jgi:hypothetical protein
LHTGLWGQSIGLGRGVASKQVFAITVATAALFFVGVAREARAQVNLTNIQTTLQTYAISLPGIGAAQQINTNNIGACLDDAALIRYLIQQHQIDPSSGPVAKFLRQPENRLIAATIVSEYFSNAVLILRFYRYHLLDRPQLQKKLGTEIIPEDNHASNDDKNPFVQFWKRPEHRQLAWDILVDLLQRQPDAIIKLLAESDAAPRLAQMAPEERAKVEERVKQLTAPSTIPFCTPAAEPAKNPQPVVKFNLPFNPTYESNVLKSDLHNSPGGSIGFGGLLQIVAPAPTGPVGRTFDVIALSEQEQSVRYGQYPSKSFDSLITQGAYQYFLGASGYDELKRSFSPITTDTPKTDIPPLNLITINSLAFGIQDQAVFTPGFRSESVDLFTPQVTFNRQNQDLSFDHTTCWAQVLDPRQKGFCYYTDLSLTLGQTFSDVPTQTNSNIAVAATPGWRIPYSDWKLTLPMTMTGRAYEQVAGGRDDLLLQIGPALTYAPPAIFDRLGFAYAINFSVSLTYNQNYSTLLTAAWRGYIVMPTLTVAFQPPPPLTN